MPKQFEKANNQEQELSKINPRKVNIPKPIELTPEQDENLLDLAIKARTAEKQGDIKTAIEFYREYKEQYMKLKGEKEIEEGDNFETTESNYKEYECIKTLEGHDDDVNSVIESHDHEHLISASTDKTIKIWDRESGECLKTLEGHNGYVYSVIESHNRKHLISGSTDDTIKIWNKKTGECIKTLEGHDGSVEVIESRDHKHLISAVTSKTIKIWGKKE